MMQYFVSISIVCPFSLLKFQRFKLISFLIVVIQLIICSFVVVSNLICFNHIFLIYFAVEYFFAGSQVFPQMGAPAFLPTAAVTSIHRIFELFCHHSSHFICRLTYRFCFAFHLCHLLNKSSYCYIQVYIGPTAGFFKDHVSV